VQRWARDKNADVSRQPIVSLVSENFHFCGALTPIFAPASQTTFSVDFNNAFVAITTLPSAHKVSDCAPFLRRAAVASFPRKLAFHRCHKVDVSLEELKMKRIPKYVFTTEFEELAVKRGSNGQTIAAAAQESGLTGQTMLRSWIKVAGAGKLKLTVGTPERKRLTVDQTLLVIRASHAELEGAYGNPRMMRELRLRGFTAGKERVEMLMREIHPCASQAALRGQHGLETQLARDIASARLKIHSTSGPRTGVNEHEQENTTYPERCR
jgi:transposase-like protein